MILLKRYWYETRLKYLINKVDSCADPKIQKDLNKKIYSLHLQLNELEQQYTSGIQGTENFNR